MYTVSIGHCFELEGRVLVDLILEELIRLSSTSQKLMIDSPKKNMIYAAVSMVNQHLAINISFFHALLSSSQDSLFCDNLLIQTFGEKIFHNQQSPFHHHRIEAVFWHYNHKRHG